MKCRNCGTEIAEKALICFRCGTAVEEPVTRPYTPAKRRRRLVVYVVFAILVLIAMLALWLLSGEPLLDRTERLQHDMSNNFEASCRGLIDRVA